MAGSWRVFLCTVVLAGLGLQTGFAQLAIPDANAQAAPNPLTDPTVKPGKMLLFDLEARFAKDVLERGGAGFADWFAEDGVALGNAAQPLIGKVAIAKSANWDPKVYQLTWTPTDARDGPFWRHGLHLGPLRGPQQGRERQSGDDDRALYDHLAQGRRRPVEGGSGCRRQ